MLIASFQAPYLPFGSMDAVELIAEQLVICEREGVEILCCPEAIVGGLAHEAAGQSPASVAVRADNGELDHVLGPLLETTVTVIVGFTECDAEGGLFNSAAAVSGRRDRRHLPEAVPRLPNHRAGWHAAPAVPQECDPVRRPDLQRRWYMEPARVLAAKGAAIIFVPSNSGHLLIVGVESKRRPHDPRGWDGYTNATVSQEFWDVVRGPSPPT